MSGPMPRWTLDRRIPVWGIILLVGTCLSSGVGAAAVVGASAQRLDTLESKVAAMQADHDLLTGVAKDVGSLSRDMDRLMDCQFEGRCKR